MSKRWIAIGLVAALGAGVAVLYGLRSGEPWQTPASTDGVPAALAPTAETAPGGGTALDQTAVQERLAALTSQYAALEWPASTAEEIGRVLGHDPGRCLGFVRSALRYEPYAGVLRGSAGALAAGGGNSADLALVLHDMLRGGVTAGNMRFATVTLPADRAATLVQDAMRAAPAQTAWAVSGTVPADAPATRDGDQDRMALHRAGAELERVFAGAREHRTALDRLLPTTALQDDRETARAAARRHVWLQVRRGSDWLSFDPVLGDTGPAPESVSADLPATIRQMVSISIAVEHNDNGRLVRSPVMSREWPASALDTRPLRIVVVPDGATAETFAAAKAGQSPRERAKSWQAFRVGLTLSGDRPIVSDAFGLSGARVASGPFGTVDVFGSARQRIGAAKEATQAPVSLTGLLLSIRLTAPDAEPVAIERWLFDRIGPAARADGRPAIRPALADAEAVAFAVVQRLDLLFPSGRMSTLALARDALAPVASSALLARVAELNRGAAVSLDDLTLPSLPADLIQISDTALAQVDARLAGRGRAFLSRPNVLIRSEGFTFDGTAVRARATIDIARGALTALADLPAAVDARRWYGLLVSELEGPALKATAPSGRVESAADTLRALGRAGVPFEVVSATGDLARLGLDADSKAAMTSDLRDGHSLVAPVRLAGGMAAAWWRVDRGGGVVAIGRDGRGQAGSEGMMVLTDISIPSVERTMKFTACFNEAIAGGGTMSNAGGACLAQAIVDIVKSSLDTAIDSFIKNPINNAMDEARAGMLGKEYDELYQKAKDAWGKFQQAQAVLDDPVGQTIDKISGVQEGREAADAGRRIGSAFGFRLYLMMTMGSDIAASAAKR